MISKPVLVFLVVYFMSKSSLAGRHENYFRKDYRYLKTVEGFYKIHMIARTFEDAKRICALEGASLFYPDDQDEADAVIEYWKNLHPSSTWAVVVALTDSKSEGNFETIDEIPVSDVYYKWAHDEPNNRGPGDEDCVTLDKDGIMNDIQCDFMFRFICEKKEYTYIKAVDSYYKIHQKASTFAEAKRTCALESASLFYPEDKNEANAVIEFWNKTQPKQEWLIVGMSNLMTDVVFETVDGKLIYDVYENWLDGEPSDDDKHCIRLNRQGYIHDIPCTEKHRFICKRLLQPWNDDCNMANLDYTFNQNIGKCYKLHTSPLSWTEAYKVCRAEMSYLAVMNNTLEKDYLQKLANSNLKQSVAGPYQRGIFHVGIHNRFNEGWKTVTGQRINDPSAWWGNYQPAADDEKKCGSMFYTGLLNNIDCDTKSFFICENDIEGVINPAKLNEINEENIQ